MSYDLGSRPEATRPTAASMPTFTEAEVRADIERLVAEAGLSWQEFLDLGAENELCEISDDLDFAYRAILPSLSAPN